MEGAMSRSSKAKSASPVVPKSGASMYLADLPSRGLFSSTVFSSNPGGMQVYICDHDTSPPAEQLIKTNEANILIRSLTLKKQKNDCNSKDVKVKTTTDAGKGKRSAERTFDGNFAKRANVNPSSGSLQQEVLSGRTSEDFQGLTVERLRALLKERGLLTKGKKDELITRLRDHETANMRNEQEGDLEECII